MSNRVEDYHPNLTLRIQEEITIVEIHRFKLVVRVRIFIPVNKCLTGYPTVIIIVNVRHNV